MTLLATEATTAEAANRVLETTTGAVGLAWLIPLLPLAGFVVILAASRRLGDRAATVAIGASGLSFLLSVAVAFQVVGQPATHLRPLGEWITAGALQVSFDLLIDQLTVVMLVVVTGVGTLIHVYSRGYMEGDERFGRFFAYLNLFMFSMLTLVLGSSFLTMFLGWELVGLCSYLLIGFWFEDAANAVAAKKAFITNRVGDVAMMVAFFLIFATFGSLSFPDVLPEAAAMGGGTALAVGLLLLGGASAKSAQIPLFVWLPDAMAGPTPVSALIHAATMVTAGVYMLVRASPLLVQSVDVLTTIAWIGVLTALLGALIALREDDIKRILAYSTVSQLGYMVLAVGVGGFGASIFHLTTHAFFKALLFLAAGSVMHALHERTDAWRMGGLREAMPVTAATSAVAVLAISGIPPLAGFWSKDQVLTAAYEHGFTGVWVVGVLTAALTALYMGRWFLLIFWGEPRWGGGAEPHESPPSMTAPMVGLGVLAAVGGFVNLTPDGTLSRWLAPAVASTEQVALGAHGPLGEPALIAISVAAGLAGLGGAWLLYGARDLSAGRLAEPVRGTLAELAERRFFVDELYEAVLVGAGGRLAEALAWVDARLIDGFVDGTAAASRGTARFGRRLQTGVIRGYVASFVVGAVVIAAVLLGQVV